MMTLPRPHHLDSAEAHQLYTVAQELLGALNKIVNNWGDLHPKDRQQARAAITKATAQATPTGS